MNAATHALGRPGRRIAQLDPWLETEVEPVAGYGCVDWYVYGEEGTAADVHAAGARPGTVPPAVPAGTPSEPPARRH